MCFTNLKETAQALGVEPPVLGKMARCKEIPAAKLGREWRFDLELVKRAIHEKMLEPAAPKEAKTRAPRAPRLNMARTHDREARDKLSKLLGNLSYG